MTDGLLNSLPARSLSFRHSAGFGKRMEYWLIGCMLKEGLDVYLPQVDDFGVNAMIRKSSQTQPDRHRTDTNSREVAVAY